MIPSEALELRLNALCKSQDVRARLAQDPLGIVHEAQGKADKELVGLLAASMAFGNVTTIRAKIREVLHRLDGEPTLRCGDLVRMKRSLRGFRHRVFQGDEVAHLLHGAYRLQQEDGSLGAHFETAFALHGSLRQALVEFVSLIRARAGLEAVGKSRMGPRHILPEPRLGGACKRLLLYFRWMCRGPDGVDLGMWNIPSSALVIPLDVHIHRIARNIGLTDRKDASFATAEDITEALRKFDPEDPVRYDFALCHLGIVQKCPSRQDSEACKGCQVMPICRFWDRNARGPRRRT